MSSGGASAVKEPAHFEVRNSSSRVTRMHFLVLALKTQNTGRQRRFTVKMKLETRNETPWCSAATEVECEKRSATV